MQEPGILSLSFAGVTESTARAVMPLSGKGDKHEADHTAVEAMRKALNALEGRYHVVLGEGGKDKAPMLYTGEVLGTGRDTRIEMDLVVDPLECTTNFARGLPDSMSVLLAAPTGRLRPVPGSYMKQLLLPPAAADFSKAGLELDSEPADVLPFVARSLGLGVSDLCVVVQDRPRHAALIAAIRAAGAGVSLIDSGSISAAFEVLKGPSRRTHLLWGTFGAPEALIIAFMARHSRAPFFGRMEPHDDLSAEETRKLGLEGHLLLAQDLVGDSSVLSMSGIHSSNWLAGVKRLSHESYLVSTLLWDDTGPYLVEHRDGAVIVARPWVEESG